MLNLFKIIKKKNVYLKLQLFLINKNLSFFIFLFFGKKNIML